MTTNLCFIILVLGCLAIGGFLVVQGHPWFGGLAMIVGAGASIKKDN